jgi:HK97 family phage major capsid protein
MDVTLKAISEDLHKTLAQIQNINASQKAYEEKTGQELGELKESHTKALKDFDEKLTKGEKLQKDLQKSITNLATLENTAETLKDIKSYNKLLVSFKKPELDQEGFKEVTKSFERYLRFGPKALQDNEQKSLNTVLDPQGGFFVLPQYAPDVENQAIELHGILGIVNRFNASSSPVRLPVDWFQWGDSAYKNELTVLPTPTTPSPFKEVSIPVTSQFYGLPFSRELLEDSFFDIQNHVIGRMREGMDDQTGTNLITGDGSDKPRGILTYPAGTDFGEIEQVTSTTSAVITWDDVMIELPSVIKPVYNNSQRSSYLMEKSTFYKLLGDKDGSARYQVSNQVNFFSGQGISLGILGSPVIWEPAMPAVASDALSVAFGDFKRAYTFVERVGTSVHRDESNAAILTLTLRRRNGGGVVNSEAIKILKIKT